MFLLNCLCLVWKHKGFNVQFVWMLQLNLFIIQNRMRFAQFFFVFLKLFLFIFIFLFLMLIFFLLLFDKQMFYFCFVFLLCLCLFFLNSGHCLLPILHNNMVVEIQNMSNLQESCFCCQHGSSSSSVDVCL